MTTFGLNRSDFNNVVETLTDRVYGFALSLLANEHDARDIVQDSFEKLWKQRRKVKPAKAKAWLFATTYNASINLLKKKKPMYVEDYCKIEPFVTTGSFELQNLVEHCLNLLPDVQRSVLTLRDKEGYNYQEIGEIMNLNESQVKVYLFRARKKIKAQLKDLSAHVA